jgi:hypothetical protein
VTKPGLSTTEVGKIAGAEGGKATRIGQSNIYCDRPAAAGF